MPDFIKKQPTGRIIAMGFALVILAGSGLLMLPCSVASGVQLPYIDALYTATSSVCVTGLTVVDTGDAFTPLGQFFIALMIQIGGLGVTSVGSFIIVALGRKVNFKGRNIIRDTMNLSTSKGLVKLLKSIFVMTLIFEAAGAVIGFFVFAGDFEPMRAIGISLFHSVAAFNNSGFDILGGFCSLTPYCDDTLLNLVTCLLIFFGGIGFPVIMEALSKRFRWGKFSMHAKAVLSTSAALIIAGALLLKFTEHVTWMEAVFHSVSARTAGFSTVPMGEFSDAGLLTMMVLMFIGASPGSTGGGIKTGTFFVILLGIKASATNKNQEAFHYAVPEGGFRKASVIALIGISVIMVGSYIMMMLEPELPMRDLLFEVTSAFGTAGLSTGITPGLGTGSKLLSIVIMYIGRLGPLTIATLWYFTKGERTSYPDGNITIG